VDSVEAVTKLENVHRRRLKIRRMKYSCHAKIHVGNNSDGCTVTENERPEIHESVKISLSLATSSSSEEEDRTSKRNGSEVLSYGTVSTIGTRKEMEDAVSVEIGFAVKDNEKCDFFGVYDGHGGAQVAEACKERLHRVVAEEVERCGKDEEWDWERVMEGCFGKMDRELAGDAAVRTVGSTAVVAVVAKADIVIANCGDSRAVMGRAGETMDLSTDHKVCINLLFLN
jgi:protein phosphatase 2C